MLSDAEIIRRLTIIRRSSRYERYARRIPPLNALAFAAGLSPRQLFRISNGRGLGPKSRSALSHAMTCDTLTGARTEGHPPQEGPARPI